MQYYFASLLQFADYGLLALRLAVGVIFIYHGLHKFNAWSSFVKTSENKKSGSSGGGMLWINRFLFIAEPLGGFAVLIGFMTQAAAVGLGIIMLGAIFLKITKWKIPFSAHDMMGWEFDFMILAGCVAIFFFGAGVISVDRLIFWL